jgi:hypothetical protein
MKPTVFLSSYDGDLPAYAVSFVKELGEFASVYPDWSLATGVSFTVQWQALPPLGRQNFG